MMVLNSQIAFGNRSGVIRDLLGLIHCGTEY